VRYVQRVSRIRDVAREYWFELLIAVMAIAGMLELVVGRNSPGAPSTTLWFTIPAVGVLVAPLFLRRRFPFAGPAAYFVLAAALSYIDALLVPFIGSLGVVGLAAAFMLGWYVRNSLQTVLGLVLTLGSLVIIVYKIPGAQTVGDFIFLPLRFAVAWVAGYAVRVRSEQAEAAEVRATRAERDREAAARVAVAEERSRIARELHDIVAHAVSVMVLQVGAVRHKLPPALAEASDALKSVERTGRTALAEMRQLLAAMRPDGDEAEFTPQPGLDGLDSLLKDIDRAGLPVRLHADGDPFPLPRAVDLSAYRIIQEGLTNALKHAQASHADVIVRYGSDELQIEIRDDGRGAATTDGLGHGLVGVRERIKIYGGEMSAGTATEGGFVLSTRLPINGDQT
jgi:signal transduction histidine kinase